MPKKYFILTLGCQMNHSDSERIRAVLESMGWENTEKEDQADLVIVNSCSVRQTAIDRIYGRIRKWEKIKKERDFKILLTGCVLPHDRNKMEKSFDWFLPIFEIGKLPKLLEGKDSFEGETYFEIKPKNLSSFSANVPIMTGCDKFCSYCAVPYTRGREVSRPYNEIFKEVEDLVQRGYKEIILLGQNVNSYMGASDHEIYSRHVGRLGRQLKSLKINDQLDSTNCKVENTITFPELLKKVASISGDFWIRFVSSHPYDMSDDLIEVMLKESKVCSQINLAAQSGDDEVLKRMNRHYTSAHFLERVQKLKKAIPEIMISTDIIVGFCGETKEAFQNTVKLFQKVEFEMAYISKYSPRPGTLAQKQFKDDIPFSVKKEREKKLTDILKQINLRKNKSLVGKRRRVLVDKAKKDSQGIVWNLGRTEGLKPVKFAAGRDFTGEFVEVEIVSAGPWSLESRLA